MQHFSNPLLWIIVKSTFDFDPFRIVLRIIMRAQMSFSRPVVFALNLRFTCMLNFPPLKNQPPRIP